MFKKLDPSSYKIFQSIVGKKTAPKRRRSTRLTKKQQQIQNAKIRRAVSRAKGKAFRAGLNARRAK